MPVRFACKIRAGLSFLFGEQREPAEKRSVLWAAYLRVFMQYAVLFWCHSFEFMEGSYIAEAADVTALLGKEELIDYQNQFVAFKGMTVEASTDADGNEATFLYGWDGSGEDGSDLYFNASVDGQTYTFTVESYLCDKTTDVYAAVKNLQIGDKIDMEGFLYWYEGVNPHITSVTVVE